MMEFLEMSLDATEGFEMLDFLGMFLVPDEVFEMMRFFGMSLIPEEDLDFVFSCDIVASHTTQNYMHRS